MKTKVICIGGPTGVGKTALAIELANKFNGEIISCDSIAIYKELDIGSAKPTREEQQLAKHYMIDIIEPYKEFSVAEYCGLAEKYIKDIASRGKLPIIVGGTGLYMKCLLFDMSLGGSEKSNNIREKFKKFIAENGNEKLFQYLEQIDPQSAKEIHPNDTKKVIRAIEIFEATGKPKSTYKTETESKYDYFLIYLNTDRKVLYQRIDKRVDKMFELGLEDEVKNLVKNRNLTRENQSMQAIGYKEFFDYFDGKIDHTQLVELIKQNSRHYAKRQLTWFKKMPNAQQFDYENKDTIIDKVKMFLEGDSLWKKLLLQ